MSEEDLGFTDRCADGRIEKINFFGNQSDAMHEQVGGDHYKNMPIQPVTFCMANGLNFCVSSAIKYLCRYKNKNGKEDLMKARHFIDMLIEFEYPEPVFFENV